MDSLFETLVAAAIACQAPPNTSRQHDREGAGANQRP